MNHGMTSVVFRLAFCWSFRNQELESALFAYTQNTEHHSTATYYKNVQLLLCLTNAEEPQSCCCGPLASRA